MTTARRDLERQLSPAYAELLADRAVEAAEEQRQKDAAAQAAIDADPVKQFEKVANAEAEENRRIVLNYRLTDLCLSQHGVVKHAAPASDTDMRAMMFEFKNLTPSFINTADNVVLLAEFVKRNELKNCLESYALAHTMLTHFACYSDDVQTVAPAPVVEAAPVLSRSEQAVLKHHAYMSEIVGVDEMGRQWTEEAIDRELSAKDGLRLRRLFEQGHCGSNLLTVYREIQDIQQQQAAERDRIAAEEIQ